MGMKVVVNYLGRKGGGMVYAYEMTKGLIENGCEVYAIIPESIENLSLWQQLPLKELIAVKTYSSIKSFILNTFKFSLSGYWKLRKHFKDVDVDICYVPMIQPWSILVNRIFKKSKCFVTVHDPKPHSGKTSLSRKFLHDNIVRKADSVIILSDTFREYTCKHYGKQNADVHTIPHGVFDYYKQFKVESVNSKRAEMEFLFFGRIEPYKGLNILSEAYKKLKSEGHNISLTIAGSGDFSAYREVYSKLDDVYIDNRFIPDNEVNSYFCRDRVISVLPYLTATQSGVIPIAFQARSLVVATDTGGLREQTCDGQYAILCSPDAESLYNAMKKAVLNYDSYSKMRDNAEVYVRSLSWDKLSSGLKELFEKYLH